MLQTLPMIVQIMVKNFGLLFEPLRLNSLLVLLKLTILVLLILLPLQILSMTFFIKFYHFWWTWYSGYLVWSSRCSLFDWYSNQFLWGSENHQVLKNGKAPGPDGITSTMLKHTATQVAFPLAMIFNISLKEGKIPDDWKWANVVPIHKSGDIGSINNYRPISLCSVVGKLLERVVTRNVVEYIYANEWTYLSSTTWFYVRSILYHPSNKGLPPLDADSW